ncbi:hypothetical protein [Burkholderia vietnamiensis]|uniref:hypothetical protein n=1 Tax=Burkholderia vietnamiensis TaxID=60552 RepID=UPI001CF24434|nr:hypothetical protein [Burkholderia vietnamiensis]MCA8446240.1 hypothetical protein [Burkholderia vietnamiensis]MDN7665845.1 hypothetical protein [Burkholderia vietnamiensis]
MATPLRRRSAGGAARAARRRPAIRDQPPLAPVVPDAAPGMLAAPPVVPAVPLSAPAAPLLGVPDGAVDGAGDMPPTALASDVAPAPVSVSLFF